MKRSRTKSEGRNSNFPFRIPQTKAIPIAIEGRDLAVTTDFRDVFAEVLKKQLGVPSLKSVFPGYAPRTLGILA